MTGVVEKSKKELYPRVADLYNGKSVFITGAAGFVGMVLLEILLRTCPGIKSIYILIREKKGVKPEQRKEKLFQKEIFNQLKADQPDALDKVRLVSGDIAEPDLGMSQQDIDDVIRDVSIVFHSAADLNFVKPIKHLMGINAVGTYYVVQLCKKLKEFDALVYTSTICSNVNRDEMIQEVVYRLPFPTERFFKEFREGTDESVQAMADTCYPHWPNGYTFTKCLAENVLLEHAEEVPLAIVRPAIVASTFKAPHPGFCEKNSTLTLLTEGCGKGFIKVILADPENANDFVPVDMVVNCLIVAAWKVATQRCSIPFVVNCSCYGFLHETWGDMKKVLLKMTEEHPVPNGFRKPTYVVMTSNYFLFRILCFYEHYVPAYVIDMLLKLSGKKLRLVRLYNLFDKAMFAGKFYTVKKAKYDTTNFRTMTDCLEESDKEKFYMDVSEATVEKIAETLPTGNNTYDWKQDKRSKENRQKKTLQLHWFSQFIKYAFLVIVFTMLYFVTSTVYQLVW